jgi:hypothetical protein
LLNVELTLLKGQESGDEKNDIFRSDDGCTTGCKFGAGERLPDRKWKL